MLLMGMTQHSKPFDSSELVRQECLKAEWPFKYLNAQQTTACLFFFTSAVSWSSVLLQIDPYSSPDFQASPFHLLTQHVFLALNLRLPKLNSTFFSHTLNLHNFYIPHCEGEVYGAHHSGNLIEWVQETLRVENSPFFFLHSSVTYTWEGLKKCFVK